MTLLDIVLICLVVFQQLYWSMLHNKLVDKLMSRNYYEYKQAESLETRKVREKTVVPDQQDHDIDIMRDFGAL